MLRFFSRTAQSSVKSAFRPNPVLNIIPQAAMSTCKLCRHPRRLASSYSYVLAKATNDQFKVNDLFDVSHVTAVVTGGGTGIGLMIAQALVSNGAKVYITGRRAEVLESTVKQYNTGPGSLHALPGDVSEKQDVIRLAKEIEQKEPNGIQLLVNNAGVARDDNTKFCKPSCSLF